MGVRTNPPSPGRVGAVLQKTRVTYSLRECKDGLFLYPKHDEYVGACLEAYGEYSPMEIELFTYLVNREMVAIEIGAHIGSHTVPLSRLVKRLWVFEPQRRIFQALCANLALNEIDNVHALPFAIGDQNATIICPQSRWDEPANTGGVSMLNPKTGEEIEMKTLDSLRINAGFVKVDVEDMELNVLKGAQKFIERNRPVFYLEANGTHAPIIEHLKDYDCYWHFPPLADGENFRGNTDNIFGTVLKVSHNLLCIPSEIPCECGLPKASRTDDMIEVRRKVYEPFGLT